MATITRNQFRNGTIVPISYDSNNEQFEFEYFTHDLSGAEQLYDYLGTVQADETPNSVITPVFTVFTPQLGALQVDYTLITFITNQTGFNVIKKDFFGYSILRTKRRSMFMDIVSSGVNDFVPPKAQKTFVYDFKFIKSAGDYAFMESEPLSSEASEDTTTDSGGSTSGTSSETSDSSSGASTSSTGGGY
tara:strand:+ start:124 stop:693 length:570 start_codon:yes stop_codon:yes gene_type:complete